jgi:hypothetical protein
LVPGARIALPFIERMVAEGLSTTVIQETLRAAGTSVRRTDFLELVRAVREVNLSRDYLKSVPKKFLPNPARLPKPVGTTLRKFSFRVTIRGQGGVTGAAGEQHITVSSSVNLSRSAVEERALSLFLAQQQQYRGGEEELEPDTIELETGAATYNPDAP